MEVRMYRDPNHPELVDAIDAELAGAELATTLRPMVTGLMGTFGMTIAEAVAMVRRAVAIR